MCARLYLLFPPHKSLRSLIAFGGDGGKVDALYGVGGDERDWGFIWVRGQRGHYGGLPSSCFFF